MATQSNDNVVLYEFQGDTVPLEKAFAQVGKLFRRYIREAKEAAKVADPIGNPKGVLGKDEQDAIKTIKHYYKRLKVLKEKSQTVGGLSKDEEKEARSILKKLATRTNDFMKMRDKVIRESNKKLRKQEEQEREKKDWTATSTQFRAGIQAEQLQLLMKQLPGLPPEIVADINSYIEAWRNAVTELDIAKETSNGVTEATERLATATKNLDEKSREYSKTLITIQQNAKKADTALGNLLMPIARMISSFQFWVRIIKEGIVLLGDYVESLNFIQVAINNIKWNSLVDGAKESSKAIENLTSTIENARWSLGLNATDTNTAAATYISFANAMNLTGDAVAKFSQNMTQLSIDMASLYNKDVIVMMTALRSGLAGNTRALMNYGMSVHDATLNEWMYSKGINKTMTSLSETSQMMVRYMYIMEKTTAAQGDLNRTLKSPANQLRVLRNQISLLMQNIGAIFNIIIYPAIRILNTILTPLNAFISALTALADNDYSTAVGSTADSFDDLADAIDNADGAAKGLSALDEINQMTDSKKTKIGIDADIQALFDTIDVYDQFNEKTSGLVVVFRELGEVLAPIWKILSSSTVLDLFAEGLNWIGEALSWIAGLAETLGAWFDTWPDWLKTVAGGIGSVVGTLVSLTTALMAVAAGMTVVKGLMHLSIWKNFAGIVKLLWTEFRRLSKTILLNVYDAIGKLIMRILDAISAMLSWIATTIKVIALQIKQAISAWIAEKAYWKLALAIVAAAGIAAMVVAGAIAAGMAAVKSTQSANETKDFSTQGLATGGIVTQPTFAMIGEGKYNEAVIPLGNSPQMKELQQGIAERVVQTNNYYNGGNDLPSGNATVQLNIDGRALGRATINNIHKVRRQVGVDIR